MDKIKEVRRIFGDSVSQLSDEELTEEITKFDLLAECILNLSEKDLFNGKTLTDLISSKDSLPQS